MSIRRRLVAGVIVLVALGLVLADIGTFAVFRTSLDARVNDQLSLAESQMISHLDDASGPLSGLEVANALRRVTPNVDAELVGARGRPTNRPHNPMGLPGPLPVLPKRLPVEPTGLRTDRWGFYRLGGMPGSFDLGAVGQRGAYYRAQAIAVPGVGTVVFATAVAPTRRTLGLLLAIQVVVTAIMLVALALLTRLIVRVGLRPLDDIADTARAISRGDLQRRVQPADDGTEIGQLGSALNAMLERIEQAFDARTAAEERQRQFVADASHELRTPMTVIRGYSELFRRGLTDDPAVLERAMAQIDEESARMSALIEALFCLARLDEGRPLTLELVDLALVATDAARAAQGADPGRDVSLSADDPVVVLGDRDEVRQMADHLLGNALVHTPAGTAIHVRAVAGDGVGAIEVTDHGPGLSEDQAHQVFDRFYRTDAGRSRGGPGLGLSIVDTLASALDGRATVRSAPGVGSTFRFELPTAEPLLGSPAVGPEGNLLAGREEP